MHTVDFRGLTLYIPDRYYHDNLTNRFKTNSYEKEEYKIIQKYFSEEDVVLEVGSCLGVVTGMISQKCKSVISVEANPELKEPLQMMKNTNKLDNVEFISGYIDSHRHPVQFQTYDNIVAGSGDREDLEINNVRGWGDSLKTYDLESITLDSIPGTPDVNALVIDMEGGELNFITNHREFITNSVRKICIELHGHLMKDRGFDGKCLGLLKTMGFSVISRDGISYFLAKSA